MLSFLKYPVYFVFGIIDPLITFPATLTTRLLDSSTRIRTSASRLEQDDTLSECRYRLDGFEPLTLKLPDGRKLSYAIWGSTSPTAHTVFFLHGWPGSRQEATYLDEPAQSLNLRIVSVDRPGIGSSTPDPNRTLLTHAHDIEHLAQHLEADKYSVVGVSGGGPYALACAKALPADKLKVVSIVCGLGPSDIGYRGMFAMNYLGWTYGPHLVPRLTRWTMSREPFARLDLSPKERMEATLKAAEKSRAKMPPQDARLFGDVDVVKVQIRTAMDVNMRGSPWPMQDMKLLASDPGFRVEDIRKDLKVQLWYGRLDGNVPLKHGEEVARRLKTNQEIERGDQDRVCLRISEDTHASIFFDHREEFLRAIAESQ